jgi:hypothetical protein
VTVKNYPFSQSRAFGLTLNKGLTKDGAGNIVYNDAVEKKFGKNLFMIDKSLIKHIDQNRFSALMVYPPCITEIRGHYTN